MKRYFFFDIILSCIITAIPNLTESDDLSKSGYCWLYKGGNARRYYFRLMTFLIPLWIIIFINILLYIKVFRHLRSGVGGEDAKIRRELSKKISIYPIIIILCYLPYSIKGCIEVSGEWELVDYEYYFTLIAGFIRCLAGFFNALAYGFTKNVKKKLRLILCKKTYSPKNTLMAEIESKHNLSN